MSAWRHRTVMRHIRLVHNSWLKATKINQKVCLEDPGLKDATTLSFRDLGPATETITVDATTRMDRFSDVEHLVICHLEQDTALCLTILSDVLHSLPVGAVVEFLDDGVENPVVERSYFSPYFEPEPSVDSRRRYRKKARCLAEEEDDLESWSFCLPVGPGDATLLNTIVGRILEICTDDCEILISGTPADNFKYVDKVRFVPERRDTIGAASHAVNICEKKNLLVEHATKSNVCVLHDRVFLPSDFMAAMKSFGKIYGIHALQSIYFDDFVNLAPVRYSDFNVARNPAALTQTSALAKDGRTLSPYAPAAVWRPMKYAQFVYQHAMRHSPHTYTTGSLYIAKRRVWLKNPQDERLVWGDCEDVEFGVRLNAAGIPHRINPHCVTQSVHFRPLLVFQGQISCTTARGRMDVYKMPLAIRRSARRKPYFRKTLKDALAGLERVAQKYGATADIDFSPKGDDLSAQQWIQKTMEVANRVRVSLHPETIRAFVCDWEKNVHMEASNAGAIEDYIRHMYFRGETGLWDFLNDHYSLHCLLSMRTGRNLFLTRPDEGVLQKRCAVFVGSAISALRLWAGRRKMVYIPGGPIAYYRAICRSTPFTGDT